MRSYQEECDVIVLGSGFTASVMSMILAKNGVRVTMIDTGNHPRFAIGEVMVPESSFKSRLLADKYDIPEIRAISTYHYVTDKIASTSGVKRSFTSIYHDDSDNFDITQFPSISPPFGPDSHLFRQDVDYYLCNAAQKYGAKLKVDAEIGDIDISESGVVVGLGGDKTLRGKFIIDAGGKHAILAKKLDLRVPIDDSFRTRSRAIFTHMMGVKDFDEFVSPAKAKKYKMPLGQSLVQHSFDGGWIWIIPFGNHPSSTNSLCSVGLVLDSRKHPPTDIGPEEEFWLHANKFSTIGKQLEEASAVRQWVSSSGLQYASKRSYGARFALLGSASYFVDPMYSSGIGLALGQIDTFAPKLFQCLKNDDFHDETFSCLNECADFSRQQWDKIVHGSYIAFQHSDLWDAWFKVWNALAFTSNVMLLNLSAEYHKHNKDKSILDRSCSPPYDGPLATKLDHCGEFLDDVYVVACKVEAGEIGAKAGEQLVRDLLRDQKFFPLRERLKSDVRDRSFPAYTAPSMLAQAYRLKTELPEELKPYLASFGMFTVSKMFFREFWLFSKDKFGKVGNYALDIMFADKRYLKQK